MVLFEKETVTWLVVGLGNPGAEYTDTRHNAGFHAIDALAQQLGARFWKSQCSALTAIVTHEGSKVMLVKPQTFMNLSGTAVKPLAKKYEVAPDHVLVLHDELDLEPGDVRVKRDGGSAGHRGLKSITEKLATNEFPRVRIGIGRPPGRMDAADFVLQLLKGQTLEEFEVDCATAARAALCVMDEGVSAAMNTFNVRSL